MQAGEPAVGIRLRINLDRDSCGSQLGCYSVEIPDPKVHHPDLVGIPKIVARLRERTENGGTSFLLPNGFLVARWCERDPQVLLVPLPQRFRIVSSENSPPIPVTCSISVPPAKPCVTDVPVVGGGIVGSVAVCAAMPSWFRLKMKLDPKANDRIRSSWRLSKRIPSSFREERDSNYDNCTNGFLGSGISPVLPAPNPGFAALGWSRLYS
jgi:hypothetical protein